MNERDDQRPATSSPLPLDRGRLIYFVQETLGHANLSQTSNEESPRPPRLGAARWFEAKLRDRN
jgi:hypothetical protein